MKLLRLAVCVGCSPAAVCAKSDAEFKKQAEEMYSELRKLLKGNSSGKALEKFVGAHFDAEYIASNACKHRLAATEAAKLRPSIEKFGRFLFKGEAIQKVIDSTIDAGKMVVTAKKSVVFVNSELSDGTKFTTIFRASNGRIIDVRCVGISLIKVLDTVIDKYCAARGVDFRGKKPSERIEVAAAAIDWHMAGQPA